MNRIKLLNLCITVVLAATACSEGESQPESTAPPTTAAEATTTTRGEADPVSELDATLAAFIGDRDGGVAVLMIRDGITTTAAAGTADASGTPMDAGRAFRVGSVSKPFVAAMVLQMVDEGSVDLEQPLGTYLPDVSVGADTAVRDLLSHRSGIANYTDQSAFFTDVFADRSRSFTSAEVLGFVVDEPAGPVGEFSYSNTNYLLLGELIEHIDGVDLNEALQTRIAGPLGLESTVFAGRGVATPTDLVAAWSPGMQSGTLTEYESVASSAWAAGSLISTTGDLARFMTGLFGGEVISATSLEAMTDIAETGYGLGLFAAQLGPAGPGLAHNGQIFGYSSTMGISPESGDLVVVITNSDLLVADALVPRLLATW